jgi:hypothetical protein
MDKAQLEEENHFLCKRVTDIMNAWNDVEANFALLFASIIKTKMLYATVILATLAGNKLQRDVIMNAARMALRKSDLKKVEALLRRCSNAATRRNQFAHGRFMFRPRYPNRIMVVRVIASGDPGLWLYEIFSATDLKRFEDQFRSLASDVLDFAVKLRRTRRRSLPEKWPSLPRPGKASSQHSQDQSFSTSKPPLKPSQG